MDDKMPAIEAKTIGEPRNIGLDAVRSVAILLVLLSHYGGGVTYLLGFGFPLSIYLPGFFGVELFFVLSGFLIGNLLLDICQRGVSLQAWTVFMARRLMRTVPAYFAFIVMFWAITPPLPSGAYLISFLTFTQNLAWPMPPGSFFAVSWSLTIEEWFYLLFSAFLFVCASGLPRTGYWIAVAAFLTIPLIVRAAIPPDLDWDTYIRKIVGTRLDAIAYGVVLARLMRGAADLSKIRKPAMVAGVTILAILVANWLFRMQTWALHGFVWRTFIFNLTALGFLLTFPAALALRLRWRGLAFCIAWLSHLAYGLYLVHLSVLVLAWPWVAKGGLTGATALVAALLGSFVLAFVSYRYIEVPFMRRRPAQFANPARPQPHAFSNLSGNRDLARARR